MSKQINNNLSYFSRTLGARDRKKRKKRLILAGQALGVLGAVATSRYVKRSMEKAIPFRDALLNASAKGTTKIDDNFYKEFKKLPWLSKKVAWLSLEGMEVSNKIPKGVTANLKSQLKRAHYKSTGLLDDLARVRTVKKQADIGEVSGAKEFRDKAIQKARDKSVNKNGNRVKREKRRALGFNSGSSLINFSRTLGAKDKEKRKSRLGLKIVGGTLAGGAILGGSLLLKHRIPSKKSIDINVNLNKRHTEYKTRDTVVGNIAKKGINDFDKYFVQKNKVSNPKVKEILDRHKDDIAEIPSGLLGRAINKEAKVAFYKYAKQGWKKDNNARQQAGNKFKNFIEAGKQRDKAARAKATELRKKYLGFSNS